MQPSADCGQHSFDRAKSGRISETIEVKTLIERKHQFKPRVLSQKPGLELGAPMKSVSEMSVNVLGFWFWKPLDAFRNRFCPNVWPSFQVLRHFHALLRTKSAIDVIRVQQRTKVRIHSNIQETEGWQGPNDLWLPARMQGAELPQVRNKELRCILGMTLNKERPNATKPQLFNAEFVASSLFWSQTWQTAYLRKIGPYRSFIHRRSRKIVKGANVSYFRVLSMDCHPTTAKSFWKEVMFAALAGWVMLGLPTTISLTGFIVLESWGIMFSRAHSKVFHIKSWAGFHESQLVLQDGKRPSGMVHCAPEHCALEEHAARSCEGVVDAPFQCAQLAFRREADESRNLHVQDVVQH